MKWPWRRRKPECMGLIACPECGRTHNDSGLPWADIRMAKSLEDFLANGGTFVSGSGFCRICGSMLY